MRQKSGRVACVFRELHYCAAEEEKRPVIYTAGTFCRKKTIKIVMKKFAKNFYI